ncbi:MAG: hypothetical protein IJP92_12615 [Lachnospiraceae bacterium]|nr:hypothetical protein [Lachnospiraceae bacterium]
MASVLGRKWKSIGMILLSVILVFATVLIPYRKQMTGDRWVGLFAALVLALAGIWLLLKKDQNDEPGTKADEETDQAVKRFRDHLADFFEQPGMPENTLLQQSATQFLWHRLMLQKRRLNEKGLSAQVQTERKYLKRILPLKQNRYFDGKYRITEAKETIQGSVHILKKDGSGVIYRRHLPNTASYQFLHAERTDDDRIICPNCGAASTRENLMDGCDYCGTKFTIEDLGTRVSDYAYLPDYAVEKEIFDSMLRRYQRVITFMVGIPVFLYWLISMYRGFLASRWNGIMEEGSSPGIILRIFGEAVEGIVLALFFAGIFVVAALLVFYFLIAPVLLAKKMQEHSTYSTRKALEELKKSTQDNLAVAEKIRETDPLFSLEGFLANVANQLAVVHFSDHGQDAAAFTESGRTEKQIASKLPEYADIVDMTIDYMTLGNHEADELFQKIFLDAECRLLMYRDGEFREKTERIHLRMIKSASCKTQSICTPKFMICESCGASVSLLAGRKCQSCGREYNLSAVDWVIGHYGSYGGL